jgi:catechol 2,3-dioxygenase-like lactoylglutathione lyase family enzyme
MGELRQLSRGDRLVMKPSSLSWIGTRTKSYDATVAFFRDVLGLPTGVSRPSFTRFDLPDDASVEVFQPGGADDHDYFTTGPVVGIQVEDFDASRSQLERAGIALLGPVGGRVGEYRWQHFRGPDGGVYEIVDYPGRKPMGAAVGPCRVRGFGWVGVRTAHYDAMRAFVSDVIGLTIEDEEADVVEFAFPNGDVFELFRPGSSGDHPHLITGPMPGFVVDDLERAERVLRAQRIEIPKHKRVGQSGWVHFRAPDGCIYEFKRFAPEHPGRWTGP